MPPIPKKHRRRPASFLPQNEARDVAPLRAKRDANAQFARALPPGIRNHAIQTDHRQQRRAGKGASNNIVNFLEQRAMMSSIVRGSRAGRICSRSRPPVAPLATASADFPARCGRRRKRLATCPGRAAGKVQAGARFQGQDGGHCPPRPRPEAFRFSDRNSR